MTTATEHVALLAPPAIFLTSIVIAIVRLTRRRLAWWIPLVGAVAGLGVWFAAAALMSLSAGQ
ncbi:DUF6264 family protein [Diaminobutyricimonas aerilata]|uniref:DUF6264 family protein n=1 Tax=Diaminobutyricimonas aerilata TaxID=1162967 RepID=UPI000C249697|nr:DUF6264 family protein [Diaminobutyricimonas aerilata]